MQMMKQRDSNHHLKRHAKIHHLCSLAKGTKCLSLSDIFIGGIPKSVLVLKSLKHLYLHNCHLQCDFPIELSILDDLQTLDISQNCLTRIPDIVCRSLRNLRVLDISFNEITRLPASIGDLSHLTELNAAHNQLIYIPTEVSRLPLKELDLNHNMIQGIHEHLFQGKLSQTLVKLNLSHNQINLVPATIGSCCQVEHLDVSHNSLRHLPFEARKLGRIEVLIINDNVWYSGLDRHCKSAYGTNALSLLYNLAI